MYRSISLGRMRRHDRIGTIASRPAAISRSMVFIDTPSCAAASRSVSSVSSCRSAGFTVFEVDYSVSGAV
jgi:hypothetical protein